MSSEAAGLQQALCKPNKITLFYYIPLINTLLSMMDDTPNYLDIEQELNLAITLQKNIVVDVEDLSCQLTVGLHYDSQHRELILSGGIGDALSIYKPHEYEQEEFETFIFDEHVGSYVYVGIFPGLLRVGEQFLEAETLFLKLTTPAGKSKKEEKLKKTIQDVLIVVARWRQLQLKNNFKLLFAEAASILDVPRRTLQDYVSMIRLGQKYGFPFEAKLKQKVSDLRKFIKENHQAKKGGQNLPILIKFMQGQLD